MTFGAKTITSSKDERKWQETVQQFQETVNFTVS